MKILLDECVPLPMRRILDRHTCQTAQQMGWKNIRNGELLDLAEGEFDLFITADQGVRYQQNLAGRQIAIVELSTKQIALNPSCRQSDQRSCRFDRVNRVSSA